MTTRIFFKTLASCLFLFALTFHVNAQVQVGGSSSANGNYSSLAAAFTAINGSDQSGNTITITVA
jgi:hypothetical protein